MCPYIFVLISISNILIMVFRCTTLLCCLRCLPIRRGLLWRLPLLCCIWSVSLLHILRQGLPLLSCLPLLRCLLWILWLPLPWSLLRLLWLPIWRILLSDCYIYYKKSYCFILSSQNCISI